MTEFKFPYDYKRLIKNLKDENQWKILECLINENNEAKYSVILKTLQIPKGTLNYHLKELQKGGWLRKRSHKGTNLDEEGSYYQIDQFGMKILEGGLTAMSSQSYPAKDLRVLSVEITKKIQDKIKVLENNSFFGTPRTVSETVEELSKHGWIASPVDVSKTLARMSFNREISNTDIEKSDDEQLRLSPLRRRLVIGGI